jgi:site-specific DNA-methyltransferase (adenine-specific)
MQQSMLTSKKQFYETPPDLFRELDNEFKFTLDPAAEPETAKCEKYYTIHDNGLFQSWEGETVFCNPPYGRNLNKWVAKCVLEGRKPNTTVVMLIPARTDTAYFHDYIQPNAKEIRFLRGRLNFHLNGKPVGRAPFPSMVVVFKAAAGS